MQVSERLLEPLHRLIDSLWDMTDKAQRNARRAAQNKEIEANQAALRKSIVESQRLIDEASAMTQRHRRECEEDDED